MATGNIPAVAYYRMSSDKQEASIPAQREAVEKLARTRGYTIVREYKDEGISGDDTERRAGFLRMLADTKAGDLEAVLCWDQDRFGRFDPLEAGYWVKPLRDAGIYLETVAQGRIDWSDFAGRIVYAVQQEGKHAFLRDMSRTVARGMLAKAKRGEWLGGKPAYGYWLTEHKRLEPGEPADVEIVRWLFREYLARDVGLYTLAEELNARGVPPPSPGQDRTGKPRLWGPTAVHKILTRPVYLGHSVWNRRNAGAYHGVKGGDIAAATKPKGKTLRNAPADWIVFENTHEAIIDRATFDRVRQKMTARRDGCSSPARGAPFLFTGLLRCGHCGWPMHGSHLYYAGRNGKRLSYRSYVCGKYNLYRRAGCANNTILERMVLDIVLRVLRLEFLKPANLKALKAEIRRQEAEERAGREKPVAAIERRIAEMDRKINEGTERWLTAPPSLTGMLGTKLEQWRQERERLEAERRAVAKPAASPEDLDAAVETIAAELATLRDRADNLPAAEAREVIRQMVERAELWFKHVPYGRKRTISKLDHGRIHLRPELLLAPPVAIAELHLQQFADLSRAARRAVQ
jgi:DNA invertase Pin-like site-specific DNA recombinase